ncbi:MAG: TlpA family protein disulfide reductase [Roseinatronobacter sp.]|nr:TlpA family protein disulfide reductase [Roseinatronobacter sp.]
MAAIQIGPIVLGWERFAALAAVAVFLLAAEVIARVARSPALSGWAGRAVLWGFLGARLGHVAQFPDVFWAEPWLIFAIWQGGFSPVGAAVGVAVVTGHAVWRGLAFVPAFGALWLGVMLWLVLVLDLTDRPAVPAPEFGLPLLSGAEFAFDAPDAQPIVINLWATWCPPCRRELPMLADVAASMGDVRFLLASQGEGEGVVRDYLARAGIDEAHIGLDHTGALARHYGTIGLPVTLFLDQDGVLAHGHVGEISRAVLLREIATLSR